jgi:hypothetical protein
LDGDQGEVLNCLNSATQSEQLLSMTYLHTCSVAEVKFIDNLVMSRGMRRNESLSADDSVDCFALQKKKYSTKQVNNLERNPVQMYLH